MSNKDNRIICCLGDSLTEGDYGISGMSGFANIQEKNYPYFLEKISGATVRNFGKCGYTASLYLDYYKSGVVKVEDADIIIIMLGTNGGHSLSEETQGNKDYRELLNLLQRDSKAKIYLCTPPHISTSPKYIVAGFESQAEVARKFVRLLAEEYHLPLIDIANSKRINAENEDIYQGNDGLHFIEKGYQVLAEEIYEGIK